MSCAAWEVGALVGPKPTWLEEGRIAAKLSGGGDGGSSSKHNGRITQSPARAW